MKQKFKILIGISIFIVVLIGLNFLYYQIKDSQKEKLEKENTTSDTKTQYDVAKDFTVENKNGEKVKLSDFKGKPIILNFWASWCAPCKVEMPDFETVYQDEKDNVHFFMMNVTVDDVRKDAEEYISKNQFSFPVYYDTQGLASYTYRITGYPTSYFVNSNFEIVKQYNGIMSEATLRKNIELIKTM